MDRGTPTLPNLPTDAVIQLQPIAGPDDLPVGLANWLQLANAQLLSLADSSVLVAGVTVAGLKAFSMASLIGTSGFA